jgi:hypothetical protein
MKSVIFATTKTSASASIMRIIYKLAGDQYEVIGFGPDAIERVGGIKRLDIPKENHIVLHNQPQFLKLQKNPNDYFYIVNFRDPRDRMCNSFYWMQQHPQPGDTKEDIEKRAIKIKNQGIDDWVRSNVNINHESHLISFLDTLPKENYCVSTYAGLCLDFDGFVKKMASFIGVDLTNKHWELLECERVESLNKNKAYIGNKWSGSDVLPGRFRNELDQSVVRFLNNAYFGVLRSMARYDKDFSHLYLDGLPKNFPFFDLPKKLAPNFDSADILREVALQFEHSGDIPTALTIMQKALVLRPTGPFIKKKVTEYQALLSKAKH